MQDDLALLNHRDLSGCLEMTQLLAQADPVKLPDPILSDYLVLTTYILIALVFSFLCSIAEAVLLSVNRPYIENLTKQGKKVGPKLAAFKKDVDGPLAAILSLNTIAHTAGAGLAGAQAAFVFQNVGWKLTVYNTLFILILLIGSEIIPKTIGALYWKRLAPSVAIGIQWLMWILKPFVWMSGFISRRLGGAGAHGQTMSREEFQAMAEMVSNEGQMDPKESVMLRNLLRFRDTKVDSIMTPRTVVFRLPMSFTVREYVEQHLESPFSRIPLIGVDGDDVNGFVLRVQILKAHSKGELDKPIGEFMQSISAVPGETTVMMLFAQITEAGEHIALVVDEFGSMQGVVTLEDVVETLIGFEIVDETDQNIDMQHAARELWRQRAKRMGLEVEGSQERSQTDSS
jgi:CBS domain containing-hemolysin-like protein